MTDEIAKWDGPTGAKWVRHADALDRMLSPFSDAVLDRLAPRGPVSNIGCGAGALTLRLAQATGTAVGVDVSEALLRAAWSRADQTVPVMPPPASSTGLSAGK